MKKLLLSMIAFAIVSATFAQTDVFQKNKNRIASRNSAIKNNTRNFYTAQKTNSSNVNVAQLMKESWWDDFFSSWSPNLANRYTYTNNKLVNALRLSYTMTDTIGSTDYTYDVNGRYSSITYKNFDLITHSFVYNGRQTNTYPNNNTIISFWENYDQVNNTWIPNNRYTEVFDNYGNSLSVIGEYYDSGLWTLSFAYSKFISYYNNTLKKTMEVDSSYNDVTGMMEAEYKVVKDYDANGRAFRIISSNYNNNVEEVEEVDSIFYNANGIPNTLVGCNPLLEPYIKLTNINWGSNYDPNIDLFDNQPLGYEMFAPLGGSWFLIGRTSTTFPDNYGSEIRLEENYDNNVFVPSSRYSYLFDFNKNNIEESNEDYDAANNVWLTSYGRKNQFQYDANNNIIEDISSQFQSFDSIYHYNYKNEYSDFISIVAGLNNTNKTIEAKLFPNPTTNGKVNIDLNLEKSSSISIEVIDINGRIVNIQHEDLGQGLNTIELNGLNKGLYFVVITSDYGVSRTKLMVK